MSCDCTAEFRRHLRQVTATAGQCPGVNACCCNDCLTGRTAARRTSVTLRVVTPGPPVPSEPHDPASMVCPCRHCQRDRLQAADRAQRPARQPWEARAA